MPADDLDQVCTEGYVFLYPLVLMELTRLQFVHTPPDPDRAPASGPMNTLGHFRALPPGDLHTVVRPNFDTLYSTGFLDLTAGPVVLSVGENPDGRFYQLPLYDMWSDAFASPGQRTSGDGPGAWAVTPPGWHGELPEGLSALSAPTPHVWLIGRTQTNGVEDYPAVHAFQDSMALTPLADWGGDAAAPAPVAPDPSVDLETPPLEQVNALSGRAFFAMGLRLLARHPAHVTDWSMLARLARRGLTPGADPAGLAPEVLAAIDRAPEAGLDAIRTAAASMAPVVNGWLLALETMGVYGNAYAKRAAVAMIGLGANAPDDAVYPILVQDAEGRVPAGERAYVLHFAADALPPVDAFWSVTMYDEAGFQVPNELARFALGDRDPLVRNPDGSLDLLVQQDRPDDHLVPNWLPAPPGPMGLTMRLYAPQADVLRGRWAPPPLRPVTT